MFHFNGFIVFLCEDNYILPSIPGQLYNNKGSYDHKTTLCQ